MKTPDVIFYEAFDEEAKAIQNFLPKHISAIYSDKTIQECGHSSPPAPIVSVRTQSRFSAEWLKEADAILTRSTGYDHIIEVRNAYGYVGACGYLPLYCNRAVAEHAALLWLGLLRRLPRQEINMRTFHRDGITGYENKGKVLAIFGVGNIGYEVAKIGHGLEMNVIGIDPIQRHQDTGIFSYSESSEALANADVIACCMNLTDETYGYFNDDAWKRVKRGCIFVNVARGEQSPARALLNALNAGILAGVGLDVYSEEKSFAEHLRDGHAAEDQEVRALLELQKHDNVMFTPHNAFNTFESVIRKAEQSVSQIDHYLKNKQFIWNVT